MDDLLYPRGVDEFLQSKWGFITRLTDVQKVCPPAFRPSSKSTRSTLAYSDCEIARHPNIPYPTPRHCAHSNAQLAKCGGRVFTIRGLPTLAAKGKCVLRR